MRLRGRPEDHDEIVPVARLDEPEGPSSTRVVELTPRRRGRELALIVVAVAVVIGVGLVDDGGGEDVSAEPTTTSTRKPSTTREKPTSTTQRRAKTSSTSRPSTTTTAWPQHRTGAGPLLPDAPTRLFVGALSGNGMVTVLDVDTGDRCRTMPSRDGSWMVWNVPTVADRMLVQTSEGSVGIDRECATSKLGVNLEQGYPSAASHDRLWMASGDSSEHLAEHALPSGEATGRTVELPRFGGAVTVIVGDDLVLGMMGDMTLLDPSTDERRALGSGMPLAAHEALVAFIACPEMRCRLGFLDVTTGARRLIDGVEPTTWDPATFSRDGRLLRVPVAARDGDLPASAVVDVATGEMRVIDEPLHSPQISPDNRWLVGIADGKVVARSLDDRQLHIVLTPELSEVQGLALL